MRVLHINKFGWARGGSDIYMLRACDELSQQPGLAIGLWASNPPSSNGLVTFDMTLPDFHGAQGVRDRVAAAKNVLWSRDAQRSLAVVLDEFRPDVAHLHLYSHQLSSSIISLLHRRGIATVATAHDYKLICPAYLGSRAHEDCFACSRHLSPKLLTSRCLHDDAAWSAVAFAEAMVVRSTRVLPRLVVAPSHFVFRQLTNSWLSGLTDIRLIRHPATPSGLTWSGAGGFLLYAGRLSPEKGVDGLLARLDGLSYPLVIAGDGPERTRLEAMARDRSDVKFVGHLGQRELAELRSACVALVVPSRSPEVSCLAALEAAVDGVPILVTPRGGLPELIELGARGEVVRGDGIEALRNAIARIGEQRHRYSDVDLSKFQHAVGWQSHVDGVLGAYKDALRGPVRTARSATARKRGT